MTAFVDRSARRERPPRWRVRRLGRRLGFVIMERRDLVGLRGRTVSLLAGATARVALWGTGISVEVVTTDGWTHSTDLLSADRLPEARLFVNLFNARYGASPAPPRTGSLSDW